MKYTAVIDGAPVWQSNSVKSCKDRLDDWFLDCGLGYEGRIISGKKIVAMRSTWTTGPDRWNKINAPAPAELLARIAEF